MDFSKDFFGRRCCMTVSGQLNVETHACALSDVYTFGPTFRAENSHTARHLAEFWMIEPEICFADLSDDMSLAVSDLSWLMCCVGGCCVFLCVCGWVAIAQPRPCVLSFSIHSAHSKNAEP